jgi:hypothetical protein
LGYPAVGPAITFWGMHWYADWSEDIYYDQPTVSQSTEDSKFVVQMPLHIVIAADSLFDNFSILWKIGSNTSGFSYLTGWVTDTPWPEGWEYYSNTGVWKALKLLSSSDEADTSGVHTSNYQFTPPVDWKAIATTFGANSWGPGIPAGSFMLRRAYTATDTRKFVGLSTPGLVQRSPFGDTEWDYIGTLYDSDKILDEITLTEALPFTSIVVRAELFSHYPLPDVFAQNWRGWQNSQIPLPRVSYPDNAMTVQSALVAVELEYTIPESPKLQVNARIVAVDGLERLDGTVENEAGKIQATLFSAWQSGGPHVIQLPYPPPVGHTRNMVVSIVPPGVTPPVLVYSHSTVGVEVPIQLREV